MGKKKIQDTDKQRIKSWIWMSHFTKVCFVRVTVKVAWNRVYSDSEEISGV